MSSAPLAPSPEEQCLLEDRLLRVATCMAGMKYTASIAPLLSVSRRFRHDAQLWAAAKDWYSPLCRGSRLCYAAFSGDLVRTRFLLGVQASQAAPLLTSEYAAQCTPLVWACHKGSTEVALELLASDASGLEKAVEGSIVFDGLTPLLMACCRGHTGLALALIERGADVHTLSSVGTTSLALACYGGHIEIVRALYAKGVLVNSAEHSGYFKGRTPLMEASGEGHLAVVTFLLEHKAMVNALAPSNSAGILPALVAASANGHVEVVRALCGQWCATSLCCAMQALLLTSLYTSAPPHPTTPEHGADVEYSDREDMTALFMAEHKGHEDVVAVLHHFLPLRLWTLPNFWR